MSRTLLPLAGFEVTFNGRFWVTTEVHLITRNKKDFDTSQITVLTPEEWLILQEVATLEAKLT